MAKQIEVIKILVPYEGRIKYHEGLVVRAAISLKVMYRDSVNLIVISSKPDFVNALHQTVAHILPVMVVSEPEVSRYNLKGYTMPVVSREHPMVQAMETKGVNIHEVEPWKEESLSFNSVVFGSTFSYPNLEGLSELIPRNLRNLAPKPHVLR